MNAEEWIDKNLMFDQRVEEPTRLARIIAVMAHEGISLPGSDRAQMMRLARLLKQRGALKEHHRTGSVWYRIGRCPRM